MSYSMTGIYILHQIFFTLLPSSGCASHIQGLCICRCRGRQKTRLKPSKVLNLKTKQPKTTQGPMLSFPLMENSIGLVVFEILSFRQKTLLLYAIGLNYFLQYYFWTNSTICSKILGVDSLHFRLSVSLSIRSYVNKGVFKNIRSSFVPKFIFLSF